MALDAQTTCRLGLRPIPRRDVGKADAAFLAESGERAGCDDAERKRGSELSLAVDRLGHLLASQVTPADADARAEVGRLAQAAREATGQSFDLA